MQENSCFSLNPCKCSQCLCAYKPQPPPPPPPSIKKTLSCLWCPLVLGNNVAAAAPALERLGAEGPFDPGYHGSFAFSGCTGPTPRFYTKAEIRPRYYGPAIVAQLIPTPAAQKGLLLEEQSNRCSISAARVCTESNNFLNKFWNCLTQQFSLPASQRTTNALWVNFFHFGHILFNPARTFAVHHEKSFVPAFLRSLLITLRKRNCCFGRSLEKVLNDFRSENLYESWAAFWKLFESSVILLKIRRVSCIQCSTL